METKLRLDLEFWQKQLRLQDWDIQFKYVLNLNGKAGQCRKLSDYKVAEILVADPSTLADTCLGSRDPEVTLVHELLHLQGEELDDFIATYQDGRWHNDNERVMELTAIALVNLRYGNLRV